MVVENREGAATDVVGTVERMVVGVWKEEKVKGFTGTEVIGEGSFTGDSDFFCKNSSLLLAFRLNEEGLGFFLALGAAMGSLPLVFREKVKMEPIVREKVNHSAVQ